LNYKQQLEVIKNLNLKQEYKERTDCPFCHNKNTMLIDTTENGIKWYCFHASCKAKGKHEGEKKMDYVIKTFDKQREEKGEQFGDFEIPESFKSVFSSERAMRYLHNNNCWEAWSWNRADIKYDVRQDRVVFLVKNEFSGKYAGAVGRALNKDTFPKWFMYGNKHVPFKCGQCSDAVIVEDCASACAVSNVVTGIAIMGTSIADTHFAHLHPYKTLWVALDRDATSKSYSIAKELRAWGLQNVIVKPLEDDLKYFNTEQIRDIFYAR
jgi:ribosomal protein L37AE/L43A